MRGQLKLNHLAGDGQAAGQLGFPRPAEDDMVHLVDGIRGRLGPIGGGVKHHVAPHHHVNLLRWEQLRQPPQVGGVGDVDRNIVREQVNMKIPGHG